MRTKKPLQRKTINEVQHGRQFRGVLETTVFGKQIAD